MVRQNEQFAQLDRAEREWTSEAVFDLTHRNHCFQERAEVRRRDSADQTSLKKVN